MTAPPGPRPPDLLVSGDDRPPRRLGPRSRRAAAAVAAVLAVAGASTAVGLEVRADRAERERQQAAAADAERLRLVLLRPGEDNAPRHGPRRQGLNLVIANRGPATVRLLWGTLVPGTWRVVVPPGRELRPGRSVMLSLRPPVACGSPGPRVLQVEALTPSGRPATAEIALDDALLAYGGRLEDALASAALACDPAAAPEGDGPTYPHRS